MTFFSIIIPVYNLENYITRALDSLLKQNFAPSLFEVIAVDDGSSDNSLNILHEYAQQYKNLRVFHQENQGVSVARNLALKHVEGQYVSFLDGDDEFFKDSLKEIYAVLQKHDVDVIYNYAFVNDGTKNLRQVHKTPSRVINYEICSIKQLGDFLNGGSVWGGFYKMEFLKKNQILFPENIRNAEDTIFNYTLFSKEPRIMFSDINLYMAHVRQGSASRSPSLERAKHFAHNIDCIVDYMSSKHLTGFQYECMSLALFQSFGCGMNMLMEVGVKDARSIKEILHYDRIPHLRIPNFVFSKKLKGYLLNHCFSLYIMMFKLRNTYKS